MSELQNTSEWHAARCGKVTASRVSDVVARTKSGYGASRDRYMGEIIAERLTGVPHEGHTNAAMQRGTEMEPHALLAYSPRVGFDVEEIGFVQHPTIAMSGASPDGLVSAEGLVEIKCPMTHTHIATLLGGGIGIGYSLQIQWQLACTGRAWCDFVSFDPRMPESMRLFVKRIRRDDALITELEREVRAFLGEVDVKIATLRSQYHLREVLAEAAA